jgi:AraC-like DNA-binding protein
MSKSRQAKPVAPTARALTVGFTSGYAWQQPSLDWGVLVWASRGVTTVTVATRVWIITPHQALWVPPAVALLVRMSGRGTLRQVYLPSRAARRVARAPAVIPVTPLLREIIRRIGALETLERHRAADHRLFGLFVDELVAGLASASPDTRRRQLELPMPMDPRARRAAAAVRRDPALARRPAMLAREACASIRTLERLFHDETGLAFGIWRRRAAMIAAMGQLAEGRSVTEVATRVGYASTSAFVAAFRSLVGGTPGEYARTTSSSR